MAVAGRRRSKQLVAQGAHTSVPDDPSAAAPTAILRARRETMKRLFSRINLPFALLLLVTPFGEGQNNQPHQPLRSKSNIHF